MVSNSNNTIVSKQFYTYAWMTLVSLLVLRLISMYVIPLNDSTEARYGEIARIMLETGNWVTPMHYYGEPFWAKPPLSMWLSAGSMKLFGVNELAVRLPALVLSIGVLWLIWSVAKSRSGRFAAMVAVLVLAGTAYFFLDAGTVMTDPSLLFCTTLILISFWRAISEQNKRFGYLFFIGIGLGLLAKGPIAIVLTGLPIFFWVLIHRKWRALWQELPWLSGTLLVLCISLPWYILAEQKTPGFLNYFIMGEHVKRFLVPGWDGDKYGFAHHAHYGMIWLFALLGMLPWSIISVGWLCRHAKKLRFLCQDKENWISFLLLATLLPLVFFTFSGNIIYPYVFPSLPTFALLFAELANKTHALTTKNQMRLIRLANGVGFIFLMVTMVFLYKPEWVAKSQYRVIGEWQKLSPSLDSQLVYWTNKNDYSAEFYSKGLVKATLDPFTLCHLIANDKENYVVFRHDSATPLPQGIAAHMNKIATIPVLHLKYDLFRTDAFNVNQCNV